MRLAERVSGPVPWSVSFARPWGDALQVLDAMAPDIRLINLETAVTRLADFAPGKAVHYRTSPRNLPCVAAARPDVCALANNHVLDFGRAGLAETLDALGRAGLAAAGAGRDAAAAWQPAAVPLPGGGRVLVLSCGTASGGIPPGRAAATTWPGVSFLPSLSGASTGSLIALAEAARQDGDLVAVSIHWGANWGYGVYPDQVRFAHRLVDGGISLTPRDHRRSRHWPAPSSHVPSWSPALPG